MGLRTRTQGPDAFAAALSCSDKRIPVERATLRYCACSAARAHQQPNREPYLEVETQGFCRFLWVQSRTCPVHHALQAWHAVAQWWASGTRTPRCCGEFACCACSLQQSFRNPWLVAHWRHLTLALTPQVLHESHTVRHASTSLLFSVQFSSRFK